MLFFLLLSGFGLVTSLSLVAPEEQNSRPGKVLRTGIGAGTF